MRMKERKQAQNQGYELPIPISTYLWFAGACEEVHPADPKLHDLYDVGKQ